MGEVRGRPAHRGWGGNKEAVSVLLRYALTPAHSLSSGSKTAQPVNTHPRSICASITSHPIRPSPYPYVFSPFSSGKRLPLCAELHCQHCLSYTIIRLATLPPLPLSLPIPPPVQRVPLRAELYCQHCLSHTIIRLTTLLSRFPVPPCFSPSMQRLSLRAEWHRQHRRGDM